MSPSLKPTPVETLVMVPPTDSLSSNWVAGCTKPLLALRFVLVSTYQPAFDRPNRSLRRVHLWHEFPDSQPPSRYAINSASLAFVPRGFETLLPLARDRLVISDRRQMLVDCRQLVDSSMLVGKRLLVARERYVNRNKLRNGSVRNSFVNSNSLVKCDSLVNSNSLVISK